MILEIRAVQPMCFENLKNHPKAPILFVTNLVKNAHTVQARGSHKKAAKPTEMV